MSTSNKIFIAEPSFQGNEEKYVLDCMRSTWISSAGKYLNDFEEAFANYCGVKFAIATNNGTTALHLALVALDIQPGDEVIIPTLTYVATANVVKYCHAVPVLVDCEPNTLNIDPQKIEEKITPKTRAIIVVPLYGYPVDMEPIAKIAQKHNLKLIEDAAEALGAEYQSKKVGTYGDCGTFSFFGNKTLTTGEGGMVVTDDAELAKKLRLYRGQGQDPGRRYWFPVVGYNYRMTNLAAAIGLAQLEQIDNFLIKRKHIFETYDQLLGSVDNIELIRISDTLKHGYWMYTFFVKNAEKREPLMKFLSEKGVETRPVFYPMHVLPTYQELSERYPVATDYAARGINLPTHMNLKESDIDYICENIAMFLENNQKF